MNPPTPLASPVLNTRPVVAWKVRCADCAAAELVGGAPTLANGTDRGITVREWRGRGRIGPMTIHIDGQRMSHTHFRSLPPGGVVTVTCPRCHRRVEVTAKSLLSRVRRGVYTI